MRRYLLVAAAGLLAGCGGSGSYELRWSICSDSGDATCQVKSVLDCSRHGLDSIEVLAQRPGSGDHKRSTFPCFSPDDGPVGRGPDLESGVTELTIYGLSASAIRLTRPAVTSVSIPDEGLAQATIDIPAPPQCLDGVDNDLDGLVDLMDTDCTDGNDTDESS